VGRQEGRPLRSARFVTACFPIFFPEVLLLTATQPAGAFTPVCSANHVPEYIAKLPELRAKGVDQVAVLAYNDAFVMSAWGKANGVTGDDIVRSQSFFSQEINVPH
jgi:peroxiredoxin